VRASAASTTRVGHAVNGAAVASVTAREDVALEVAPGVGMLTVCMVCVCVHVCTCVHVFVCTCVFVFVYMCVYMFVCVYVCVCQRKSVCVQFSGVLACN
jgi:hypothetical protein